MNSRSHRAGPGLVDFIHAGPHFHRYAGRARLQGSAVDRFGAHGKKITAW
ncbi:MAG TPA: hypothetical protein VFN91_07730 [Myxococcaceae bacterium]|nr:hypothetical protein [Myxococcaceae bacterium]